MTMRPANLMRRPAARLHALCWGHSAGPLSRVVTLLLVLAACALVLSIAGRLQAKGRELAALEEQVQAAQRQAQSLSRRGPGTQAGAPPMSESQWRRYSEAIAQLNAPWPAMFDVMERVGTADAVPIGIEPDIQAGRTRIVIEAQTLPQAYAYLDRLLHDPGVRRVQPIRHELAARAVPAAVRSGTVSVRMTADIFWRLEPALAAGGM